MNHMFRAQFKKQAIAYKKRETREHTEQNKRIEAGVLEGLRREDAKRRRPYRKQICVSKGLAKCRKQMKQSQSEFASFLGISRRALVNYETGRRPTSSAVLEKILADGKVELHDVFNIEPEPVPIKTRLDIAKLTVSLIEACLEICPNAPLDRVLSHVTSDAADWPKSRRQSRANVEKVAYEIIDSITEQLEAETYWDQQSEASQRAKDLRKLGQK